MPIDFSASIDALQAEFDADEAKGFRGATVDPFPNSAYSQETDPTTSPGAGDRRGNQHFIIDEYVDSNSPYASEAHGREGIVEDSAADVANENRVLTADVAARTATAVGETDLFAAVQDGTVATCQITLDSGVTANATNYRILTVRNETKGLDAFQLSTAGTSIVAATATTVPVNGAASNREVSLDDKFILVETIAGTGVARSAGTVNLTNVQAAA